MYLDVKLEWYGGGWRNAGEPRNIFVNIGSQIKFSTSSNGNNNIGINYTSTNGKQTYYCTRSNKRILLARSNNYLPGTGTYKWYVNLTGNIKQELSGGYYSWIDYR
ncbi:hypothetical protein UJ101_00137 [Flavobacteriaceae bacterium UJ101]|nr:hypothetical protein UJ101_00137 [Flavobacteriaceae bacterium UJ101]